MAEKFSNNAQGTLAAGITDSATTIMLVDEPSAHRFVEGLVPGEFQRATITAADPNVFEIVHVTANPGALSLTVERGMEDTAALAWSAGATISARITASMLGAFAQQNGFNADPLSSFGRQFKTGNGQFVVNGRVSASYKAAQISGVHALQPVSDAVRTSSLGDGSIDMNMSHESVGCTAFVHLGDNVPNTWTAGNSYGQGSVVKPAAATGYYYALELHPGNDYSVTTTAPAFDTFGSCPVALGADDAEVGVWVAVPNPLVIKDAFPGGTRLMVSEVGFICRSYGATTAPTVSIGTPDNPTLFANAVALSQIAGEDQVHRIPVTAGGPMHWALKFTLNTPAEGVFYGRFYWRGLIVGV